MPILNISQNDDLQTVVRKCNSNFNYAYKVANSLLKNSGEAIRNMVTEFTDNLVNVVIPGQVSAAVSSAIGTDYTNVVSDFITAGDDVVITGGMAQRWGKVAKISLTFRFADTLVIAGDGKISGKDLGFLTQDWMTVGGLTNVLLDSTHHIEGVIDNNGRVAIMSADSRAYAYSIDQSTELRAGFTYLLA